MKGEAAILFMATTLPQQIIRDQHLPVNCQSSVRKMAISSVSDFAL